jgi:hypothetical protein
MPGKEKKMPGFDRTGPMGAGPMTGGGRGRCNSVNAGYYPQSARGYGFRGPGLRRGRRGGFGWTEFGWGLGRGFGRYPSAVAPTYPLNPADDINMLKSEAEYLKNSLDAINRRLDELDKKSAAEV